MSTKTYEVVNAKLFHRIGAFLLDSILCFFLFVAVYNFVSYPLAKQFWSVDLLEQQYSDLQLQYGLLIEVEDEETGDIILKYPDVITQEMYDAFYEDQQVQTVGSQLEQYNLYQIAFTFFISQFIVFFVIPLFLKNGQTIGKKMMSIGLASPNGTQVQSWQVFARFIVGIYSVETMLSIILFFYSLPFLTLLITIILGLATKRHRALHDYIAGTVVVDMRTTLVTKTLEERNQGETES